MFCDRKYCMLKNLDIKKEMKCVFYINMWENSYNILLLFYYICIYKVGCKVLYKK